LDQVNLENLTSHRYASVEKIVQHGLNSKYTKGGVNLISISPNVISYAEQTRVSVNRRRGEFKGDLQPTSSFADFSLFPWSVSCEFVPIWHLASLSFNFAS